MSVLIDTNILTRSAQPGHPMHKDAVDALNLLKARGEDLCIVAQNLVEFWAVATRSPDVNGLGMTPVQAQIELARIKGIFRFFPDISMIYETWEALVVQHTVSGKSTYDARIVAAMVTYGIRDILTFNRDDFKRYSKINVISPTDVK